MASIYNAALETLRAKKRGVMISIIHRKGSAPRKEGAHLFLETTGRIIGTIGGGGLEAEALKIAKRVSCGTGGHLQSFSLVEGDDPSDMVCGGNVTLLFEPVLPENLPIYEFVTRRMENHEPSCIVTGLERGGATSLSARIGTKGVVAPDDFLPFFPEIPVEFEERLVGWARLHLKEGRRPLRVLDNTLAGIDTRPRPCDLFVFEMIRFFPRLIIFGGGHLAQALARIAAICGFSVEVVDDREDFANEALFPDAQKVLCLPEFAEIPLFIPFDSRTFVVIATRGHRYDEEVLHQVLSRQVPYIGMVGSRSKNRIVFERLQKRGVSAAELDQVHAPIGLSIHSDTPEEIAVSIMAEIIKIKAEQPLGKLS